MAQTDYTSDVVVRELDLNAKVRELWGVNWNKPEIAYRFSNGREYELRTEDAAIYLPQP